MPLTAAKIETIKTLIVGITKNEQKAIDQFKAELNADLDVKTQDITLGNKNIAEYVADLYVDQADANVRKLLREHVLNPVLKALGDGINAPNPKTNNPLLHHILSQKPQNRSQLEAIKELLESLYYHGADFNGKNNLKETPAHTLAGEWRVGHSKDMAGEVLLVLYKYGCGFNQLNSHDHTVLDAAHSDSAINVILQCGGGKRSDIDTEIQKRKNESENLRSKANENYIIVQDAVMRHALTPIRLSGGNQPPIPEPIPVFKYTYGDINDRDDKGNNAGHRRLLNMISTLNSHQTPLFGEEKRNFDWRKEDFAEFCEHGLQLTVPNNDNQTVFNLMERSGILTELLADPRIRTAFQSQCDYATIRRILMPINEAEMKAANAAVMADAKQAAMQALASLKFLSDAEIAKALGAKKPVCPPAIILACKASMENKFMELAGGLNAAMWKELHTKLSSPADAKKAMPNLLSFCKKYYAGLAKTNPSMLDEFQKRLPQELQEEIGKIAAANAQPPAAAAYPAPLFGAAAAAAAKAEPASAVAAAGAGAGAPAPTVTTPQLGM